MKISGRLAKRFAEGAKLDAKEKRATRKAERRIAFDHYERPESIPEECFCKTPWEIRKALQQQLMG